jgi:hypothetical protein
MELRALRRCENRLDLLAHRAHVRPARLRIGALVRLPRLTDGIADLRALCVAQVQRTQRVHEAVVTVMTVLARGGAHGVRSVGRTGRRRVLRERCRRDDDCRAQRDGREEANG